MKLDIRYRGFTPATQVKARISDRVLFYLERFEQQITGVQVRVSDVNGPKGGPDKRCQITVRSKVAVAATVVADGIAPSVAVDEALAKMEHCLVRKTNRMQTLRDVTHPLRGEK